MKIHVIPDGQAPILLSIDTMKKLGAIVDYGNDEAIFTSLNDQVIVPLQKSRAGHQLLPLGQDPLRNGRQLLRPVRRLSALAEQESGPSLGRPDPECGAKKFVSGQAQSATLQEEFNCMSSASQAGNHFGESPFVGSCQGNLRQPGSRSDLGLIEQACVTAPGSVRAPCNCPRHGQFLACGSGESTDGHHQHPVPVGHRRGHSGSQATLHVQPPGVSSGARNGAWGAGESGPHRSGNASAAQGRTASSRHDCGQGKDPGPGGDEQDQGCQVARPQGDVPGEGDLLWPEAHRGRAPGAVAGEGGRSRNVHHGDDHRQAQGEDLPGDHVHGRTILPLGSERGGPVYRAGLEARALCPMVPEDFQRRDGVRQRRVDA